MVYFTKERMMLTDRRFEEIRKLEKSWQKKTSGWAMLYVEMEELKGGPRAAMIANIAAMIGITPEEFRDYYNRVIDEETAHDGPHNAQTEEELRETVYGSDK